MGDVGAEDTEAGTDADAVGTAIEVVGTVTKVVDTVAEVVGMEAEVGGTEATDNDVEVDIETDDDGTIVAGALDEVGLIELGDDVGKVIEGDDRVWDVDNDGDVETVQVLTSRTASFP